MKEEIIILETEFGDIYLSRPKEKAAAGRQNVSTGGKPSRIEKKMSQAMSGVENLFRGLQDMQQRLSPDAFTIEAGISFNTDTKLFVLSTGASVDFKVSLQWEKSDK
jgi:hypothetical protein